MSHLHLNPEQKATKALYFSIVGNLCVALMKGLTGFFGNSYALVADAIESVGDVFSSVLVLFGIRYSNKPPDEKHPYGHGRAEPLVTFIAVGVLVASALLIAYQSIQNMQKPREMPQPYTLILLGAIIITKEVFYRVISKKSNETHSSSLKADAGHHRADAITSLTAFVGISIALIFGKGYEQADDWAALVAAILIVYNAYHIFRPALGEIMDEQLYDDLIADIRRVAATVEGVIATEKCLVRKTGMTFHIDLHALVNATITVKEGHDIAHHLKEHLIKELPQIADVLIHVEPNEL
ncbi:MAG: cation diffusion facilitator family transporter [Bacteroidia bacterium]